MVEADMSRLLSDLSQTAETLNRESNTVNALIERFEARLRQLNVGIEVWCPAAVHEEPADVSDADDEDAVAGTCETQLGFIKGHGGWELYLREALYRRESDGYGAPGWELVRIEDARPLRDASRQLRIAALKCFPALLEELKREAEAALKTIEEAKRFAELC
jgi:hypothetical protein